MTTPLRLAVLLAFTLVACQPGSQPLVNRAHQKVTNGHTDGAHPAVVELEMTIGNEGALCTGTVIATHWVLTAGHCAASSESCTKCTTIPASDYTVYFTGSDGATPTSQTSVTQVILHPNFTYANGNTVPDNDIALLKITSQPSGLTMIPAMPIAQQITNADVGKDVTVVGFGMTNPSDQNSVGVKTYGTSKVEEICPLGSSCGGSYYGALPGNVCYDGDPSVICSGDSGGPDLFVRSGTTFVGGVHSFGDQGCTDACSTIVDEFNNGTTSFIQQYIGTQLANGKSCSSPNDCASGYCSGNVCCDSGCDGECNNCSTGSCVALTGPTRTGGSCDDGNPCTVNDACVSGTCQGTAKNCSPGYCDLVSGNCVGAGGCTTAADCTNPPACFSASGAACNGGTCSYPTPITCGSPPDACHSASGSCSNGKCTYPALSDGASCTLATNACAVNPTCQGGSCIASSLKTCPAPDACHSAGTCDPSNGICGSYQTLSNGTACDDHNACTDSDQCVNGVCQGTPNSNSCGADQCHDAGQCNPTTGTCSGTNKPNGTSCNDGDPNTVNDQCTDGLCKGTPQGVDPCYGKADGTACTFGSISNGACAGGVCKGGTVTCVGQPDGTACDDGNPNTSNDRCKSGVCVGTVVGDTCASQADGNPCDDGNLCTRSDMCLSGVCTGTNPVVCPAPAACKQDGVCEWQTGSCTYVNQANGTACTDGNITGQCANGHCLDSSSSGDAGSSSGDCTGKSDGTACAGGSCKSGSCVASGGGGSCGCGTAGSGPASALFLALAALAMVRRRRG